MKKITTMMYLLLGAIVGYAQNAPVDFETGGNGGSWTWTAFENDDNPALQVVANPDKSGANTSNTVAKCTTRTTGKPWAGFESNHGADIGSFTITAANSTVKIMVWKSVISDVGIKFATSTGWAKPELKVANTKINEWEELTFDFSTVDHENMTYDQIIIFPDYVARSTENVSYFDNITFGAATTVAEPTTAAADPTAPASEVISLFSDVYTNVTVDTWRTGWSNATLTETTVAGNNVKKYSSLDFVGIETTTNQIDASDMNFVNFNAWTPNATLYRIKIVDFGADGAYGGGDDSEHEIEFSAPAKDEWVTYNIPFSDFTKLANRAHLAQYIFSAQPTGGATLYLDNFYFSKNGVVTEAMPTTAAPTPTRKAADVISLFSDAYTNVAVNTWRTDWSSATLEDIEIAGNATKKYSNLDFAGIETTGANLVDATMMDSVHLMMWTPNATLFKLKIVDFGADGAFGGGDDTEHEVQIENPAQEEWVPVSLPFTAFTGLASRSKLAQYIIVAQPTGAATVYVDNVYFSKRNTDNVSKVLNVKSSIYPNPATSELNINLISADTKIETVEILDMQGRVMYSQDVNLNSFKSQVNTTSFASGLYLVKAKAQNQVFTQKVMVQ